MKIAVGTKTDIGCVREANEDSLYVEFPPEGTAPPGSYALLLVADGMGGQVAGKEASETAVDVVKSLFAEQTKTGTQLKDIRGFITAAFLEANKAVFERGTKKAVDMGTTLTAAVIDDRNAYIGHIGDSRAYLLRGREIRQVTEDHTLVEEMVKKGRASREEVKTSPLRSMLTRSIGTKAKVAVGDPAGIELEEGDCLVLCTDGLTNLVEEEEILSVIHNTPDMQKACNKLVEMARKRGGHDNITVVAAELGGLHRVKGLGIRAKTITMKPATRGVITRRRILTAALGLLIASFIFLAYLFVSHYVGEDRFYKGTSGEKDRYGG